MSNDFKLFDPYQYLPLAFNDNWWYCWRFGVLKTRDPNCQPQYFIPFRGEGTKDNPNGILMELFWENGIWGTFWESTLKQTRKPMRLNCFEFDRYQTFLLAAAILANWYTGPWADICGHHRPLTDWCRTTLDLERWNKQPVKE